MQKQDELYQVQEQISNLKSKEAQLSRREKKGELSDDEISELQDITCELERLREDEIWWKLLIQNEIKPKVYIQRTRKPCVTSMKATLEDCNRADGLALKIENLHVATPTLHIPHDYPACPPSYFLCEKLSLMENNFVLNNERSCRMIIDAILTDVLFSKVNEKLYGFLDVENDWEGDNIEYISDVDFMFCAKRYKIGVADMNCMFLLTQAKMNWETNCIAKVICEAGILLKIRLEAGQNTPVFAALTNSRIYRFFAIDTNGVVYASEELMLKIGEDGTYRSSTSLAEVNRWLSWIVSCIHSMCPNSTEKTLTQPMIEQSISKLRECFGLQVSDS